jgi:hypothetical protein
MNRKIAVVATIRQRSDVDEDAERRTYWATQSPTAKLAEVESLRRNAMIDGLQWEPMVRVAHLRRRGEPAVQRPR